MQDIRQLVTLESQDIVVIHYQAMTTKDTAGIEGLVCAVVTCGVVN
jgi:hypothetical protein